MATSAASLLHQIGSACRDGRISSALASDIRVHFASPFQSSDRVGAARALLSLLVLCGDTERLPGANAAAAASAAASAASAAQFLRSELSAPGGGGGGAAPVPRGKSSPALLAAQCLLLLTRHFQMPVTLVRDLCALLDALVEEARRLAQSGIADFAAFRQQTVAAELRAIAWLVAMSIVNSLAVWRELRDVTGKPQANALIGTSIAADVDATVAKLLTRMEARRGAAGPLSFTRSEASAGLATATATATGTVTAIPAWVAMAEGFVSMVLLGLGVFLCGRREERGLDKAVEALVGDRAHAPGATFRGKAMRHMVRLAPTSAMLVVPMELIYIAPFEIAAYMFDEMLPAIKHVADIDVRSYRRFLEERHSVEDAKRSNVDVFQDEVVPSRHARYYQPATGELQQHGTAHSRERHGVFIYETAHLLQALAVCLENLPPSVLNPDADADCAVTFFLFKNCVTHLRAVFDTQQSQGLWEPYTLKIVSAFLDVLSMIGRNPCYTERVVTLFGDMQLDCEELQWSSLISQAQECTGSGAGGSGGAASLLSLDFNGALAALRKPTTNSPTTATATATATATTDLAFSSGAGRVIGTSASHMTRHRHFTPEYHRAQQQAFVSSVFALLRQFAIHPRLCAHVSKYTGLSVALDFLYAPRLSQPVLGRVLSLIGSLVTGSKEAARVWSFLTDNNLLQSQREGGNSGASAPGDDAEIAVTVETRSLLGHCRYECHHGTYDITIGVLDLILVLLKHHVPQMGHLPTYVNIIRFVAEDIYRGVLRRFFVNNSTRYTVAAQAAAVLTRALTLRVGGETVVPFTLVMACSKAPSDVLGEALQIISEASAAPNELLNHQRAAVRQTLGMLKTAIMVKRDQGLENLFTFDARTANNRELAAQLLPLGASADSLLANKALQLLLLIPQPTVNQAARLWFGRPDVLEAVVTPFVTALRPEVVNGPVIHVPPVLAVLDHDEVHLMMPHAEVETKSLIMDLLILHAQAPPITITSWLCGYPLYGFASELLAGHCLEPIIAGANSKQVEEVHPHIAVKYVKLLYLLHANPSLGTAALHRLLENRGNRDMFNVLLSLRPNQCPPPLMSKYAFVMKLLALEVFSISINAPHELNSLTPLLQLSNMADLIHTLMQSSPCTSTLIPPKQQEQPELRITYGDTTHNGVDASTAEDFAQWSTSCLKCIPPFPASCTAPGGVEIYIYRSSDDIPQYSIPLLYEAFQKESQANSHRPLTETELLEKLTVFVKANQCLETYAGAVQFIDGWCSLVSTAVTLIETIGRKRLMYFAQSMLDCVQMTTPLTIAAQEQIVHRISQTLSTVIVQLSRKTCSDEDLREGTLDTTTAGGIVRGLGMDISHAGFGAAGEFSSTWQVQPNMSMTALTAPPTGSTLMLTQAPQVSSATNLPLEVVNRFSRKRDMTGSLVVNRTESVPGRSLRSLEKLLRALLMTTVQFGPRVPTARQHLYTAIMVFLTTPGVAVDDTALQRHHTALFHLLVEDISMVYSSNNNYSNSNNKHAALALMVQLMHLSPQLCHLFCVPLSGDGASPLMMACVTNAIRAVDDAIALFFIDGIADAASVLWLIRIVFDLLMVFSQDHALQLLQLNALSHCIAMKVWRTSARVVLGYTSSTSADVSDYSAEHTEVYREVFKNVFLSTIKWFNALLITLGDSEAAVMPIAEFVRENQQLFQSVLISPVTDSRRRCIDSLTLDLYAEIGCLLNWIASSSLADACRTLVGSFAILDLLVVLTKIEFVESPNFATETNEEAHVPMLSISGPSAGCALALPSNTQRQLIALAVQHLVQFLVRAENVALLLYGEGKGHDSTGGGVSDRDEENALPHLCNDQRSRGLIITITEQVVGTMESIYNGQVLRAAHFFPYLLAMQGLVLLLHSFVLIDRGVSTQVRGAKFGVSILHVLEGAQRVVNLWRAFHADYLKGLRVQRDGQQWSVSAPSISNRAAYPAIQQHQEKGQEQQQQQQNRLSTKEDGRMSSCPRETNTLQKANVTSSVTLGPGDSPQWCGLRRGPNTRGANLDVTQREMSLTNVKNTSLMMDQSYTNNQSIVSPQAAHGTYGELQRDTSVADNGVALYPVPDVSIGTLVEVSRTGEVPGGDTHWQQQHTRSGGAAWDEVMMLESLLRQVRVGISNAIRAASSA